MAIRISATTRSARDNAINLLDYGCIRIFKPELVTGVITLYKALRDKNRDMAAEAYKAWGFVNPSKALIEFLKYLGAQFIYAPLLEDKTRLSKKPTRAFTDAKTANKVHEELRKIGGMWKCRRNLSSWIAPRSASARFSCA